MRDPLEIVTVRLGGADFAGWSEVSIDISVEQAARTASLTASDFGGALPIRPSMPCQIFASGTLLLTGYVRSVAPQHSGDRHSVAVSIASKTIDLVEASIDHPTGFVKQKSVKEIAEAFDTSGIGVDVQGEFPAEPRSFVNTGESWFDHMERLVRSHHGMIYDDENGRARIATKPRGRHAGALSIGPGGNIISASATLTENGRFDPVKARGQSSKGETDAALRMEATARDGSLGRKRPNIIVLEGEATPGKLKSRAEQAVKRAAGYSREAQIEVSGWRDAGGRIFEPHFLIAVADSRIYIDQDMAIKSVKLSQSVVAGGPGTRASLSLCDPRALGGEASAGSKSDAAWSTPESEGTVGL